MSLKEDFPPSRAELHALELLDHLGGADQLLTLPASIVAGLLADIELWREIATARHEREQRTH